DAADVSRVARAERRDGLRAQRVELGRECGELVGVEVGFGAHGFRSGRIIRVVHSASSRSESAAEMQSWIASSGSDDTLPVTRLSTLPLRLRQEQVWQMPMRQPWRGASPAASASRSSGCVPRAVNLRAERVQSTLTATSAPAPATGAT